MESYHTPWADQHFAHNAVHFETRLEFSLESHRFSDLVPWGVAGDYLNAYLQKEQTRIDHLKGVRFTPQKNEYFPIPKKK